MGKVKSEEHGKNGGDGNDGKDGGKSEGGSMAAAFQGVQGVQGVQGDGKDEGGKLGWARHSMRLNPERDLGCERVVFPGVLEGGVDLVVGSGEVVVLSHEEWEKVKDQVDSEGRKYLVRA